MRTNIVVIIIFYILFTNVYAENLKYKDTLRALANNDIILNSELETHLSSLTMLININKNRNVEIQALKDLINTKLQTRVAQKYNIEAQENEIRSVYMQFMLRNKLSLIEYNDLVKSYNLKNNELNVFIKENIIVEKLHEKLLHQHLTTSRDELNSFLDLSNNCLLKHQLLSYKILKVSINKKNNSKRNFFNIIRIMSILKETDNKILELTNDESLTSKIEIITLNPLETLEQKVNIFIEENLEKVTIGPFYTKKKIFFFKIINKNNIVNKNDINIKVRYFFLGKFSKKACGNDINSFKNKMIYLNEIRKLIIKKKYKNKTLKTDWLNNTDIPKFLHSDIENLNDNEVSINLETADGWYVVQKIYKEYARNTIINKKLESLLKTQKLKKIRRNWIKNLQKEAYVKIY